ncbi:uncharacterized protein BT62DRAFT_1002054 [Guyanagaster necrorhizus]|uniref:Uncharacterized protein n=1 Tax=Guyanagaster necrorhizus TaxID=856835 RepID=A0A9P7VZC3_9AGAR|nr:uncharacterized protein BT62DRAFT_1002054 [Guyanagaster necrorhizus MCA 3950]KAG7449739.1 hypothetical protein BT62DRAFT_1002054 [Guyanagaster necrorhizus MCA 3950]
MAQDQSPENEPFFSNPCSPFTSFLINLNVHETPQNDAETTSETRKGAYAELRSDQHVITGLRFCAERIPSIYVGLSGGWGMCIVECDPSKCMLRGHSWMPLKGNIKDLDRSEGSETREFLCFDRHLIVLAGIALYSWLLKVSPKQVQRGTVIRFSFSPPSPADRLVHSLVPVRFTADRSPPNYSAKVNATPAVTTLANERSNHLGGGQLSLRRLLRLRLLRSPSKILDTSRRSASKESYRLQRMIVFTVKPGGIETARARSDFTVGGREPTERVPRRRKSAKNEDKAMGIGGRAFQAVDMIDFLLIFPLRMAMSHRTEESHGVDTRISTEFLIGKLHVHVMRTRCLNVNVSSYHDAFPSRWIYLSGVGAEGLTF